MIWFRYSPLAVVLLFIGAAGGLAGCGNRSANVATAGAETGPLESPAASSEPSPYLTTSFVPIQSAPSADPIVVLHTSAGDIKLLLYSGKSPLTVDNFLLSYAGRGFYDQTV